MVEVYAKLVLDGGDAVPVLTLARQVEQTVAGERFSARTEDGRTAHVVIDAVEVGDFAPACDACRTCSEEADRPAIPEHVAAMDGFEVRLAAERLIGEDRCDAETLRELVAQFGDTDS